MYIMQKLALIIGNEAFNLIITPIAGIINLFAKLVLSLSS